MSLWATGPSTKPHAIFLEQPSLWICQVEQIESEVSTHVETRISHFHLLPNGGIEGEVSHTSEPKIICVRAFGRDGNGWSKQLSILRMLASD